MIAKLTAIVTKTILSLLLAVIVGALVVLTVVPRAVHGSALTVLTGSMTPTIPVGSVVVVRPVDPGTLRVGDVITYQKEPGKAEFVTHRITAIHPDTTPVTLTTKGDANRGADLRPVPVTAVRGQVLLHVPYLGTAREAVSTGGAGLLLLVGLIGYAVVQVVSVLRDRRSEAAVTTAAPGEPDRGGLVLQLVVATFPVSQYDRLLPCLSAQLLRVDLLEETAEEFTVAIARQPEHLGELTEFLRLFTPISLGRSDLVTVPLQATGDPTTAIVAPRQRRAVGRHAA